MPEAKVKIPKQPKSAEDQMQLQKDYKFTFSSTEGKRVLNDLEIRNWIRTPTISGERHMMAYREGQRSVLLHIKSMIDLDPKRIREMIEQMERGQEMEPEL